MKLIRPIVFFDVETTGKDVTTDRIVQLACVKLNTDGSKEQKDIMLNPDFPISVEATTLHGITNEMVVDKPKFRKIAKSLLDFFKDCDLGGYNSDVFDIPILIEEFQRCGIDFPDWDLNLVDVLKHERLINNNKLESVYRRYTGKNLENSHNALCDVLATVEVLEHQIRLLDDSKEHTPQSIDLFCQGDKKRFDISGKAYFNADDVVCWSFGKNIDKPVMNDKSYLDWVLNANFPNETKNKLKKLNK